MVLDAEYFGASTYYTSCNTAGDCTEQTTTAGDGAANADFVLIVSAQQVSNCNSGAAAYASTCLRDDLDRPVAGHFNMCPNSLSTNTNDLAKMRQIALHEVFHPIFFSSSNFKYMRNPSSLEPYLDRDESIEGRLDVTTHSTSCDGGGTQSNPAFPSDVIQWSGERGQPSCPDDATAATLGQSSCTQRVVLPKVRDAARHYFGCDDLAGPELENDDTSCSHVSSHWERRMFYSDTMATHIGDHSITTPVTLAFFESSGWYKANYTSVQSIEAPGRDWARYAGCDLARDEKGLSGSPLASVTSDAPASTGRSYFCTETETYSVCSFDRRERGSCQIKSDYGASDLPTYRRYFGESAAPYKAGNSKQLDYLPYVTGSDCSDTDNHRSGQYDAEFGTFYGAKSACFDATLVLSDS